MRVIYMAHPVSGYVAANLETSRHLIRKLQSEYPDVALIAPWITWCELYDDDNPQQRAEGMARCRAVVACCDEFWMVGPHVSPGMLEECQEAKRNGLVVRNMTKAATRG